MTALPAALAADLAAPAEPRDQALLLLTVDEAGPPRVALLSRAEVFVAGEDRLLLALWSSSRSASNVERAGCATLFWTAGGAAVSASLHRTGSELLVAAPSGAPAGRALLAVSLRVVDVRVDEVGYADLVSPLTFALREPQDVLPRWEDVRRRLAVLAQGSVDPGGSGD